MVAREGWPRDVAGLRLLPGIGPYTAAAVASFAFGLQVAAVDTNVRRVIARLDRRERTPAALEERADALLPAGRAADWNQAMMELGATVCASRTPVCDACPATGCRSRGRPALAAAGRARGAGGALARTRFEDSDRFVRGRIVAALAAGQPVPAGFEAVRLERALAGLERDGLVVREGASVRLP
jgi:A/G-specific adenine glycosylase